MFDAGGHAAAGPSAIPLASAAPGIDGGARAVDSIAHADVDASSAGTGTVTGGDGEDAGALPQTNEKPTASGAAFDARVHALFDAIVADDPDKAMPFFFPLAAYEQVKAIQHPARDWKYRLVAAYVRDIHDLHQEVGASAKYVGIDVPDAKARWVDPGEEYNKIGYWRVYGTAIEYERGGRERTIRVVSMISWRGEWFVVHLSAIK